MYIKMKHIFSFLFLFLLVACPVTAQWMENQAYAISHIQEYHLMSRMNQLTLVNIDFEWPDRLCGSDVPLLKKELCKLLFDNEATDMRQGINGFLAKCGKEIDAMPNAKGLKTTYVTYQVMELAMQMDKYVSFEVAKTMRYDNSLKPYIQEDYLLTYDMVNDRVLKTKDILKSQYLPDGLAQDEIVNMVFENPEIDGYFDVIQWYMIPDQTCLSPEGLMVTLPRTTMYAIIPNWKVNYCYKKEVKQLLNKAQVKTRNSSGKEPLDPTSLGTVTVDETQPVDTNMVYASAAVMPEYEGGMQAMMDDLVRWVEYPDDELANNIQGKCVVSFIVERDGGVSSPVVISPLSPGIDRAAVKAVMSLSKWKPGAFGSTPVRVRMAIPVSFKVER